jgi:hypothetical protein
VNARLIHHAEYVVLLVVLVTLAAWQRDQLNAWLFWPLVLAPDVLGYLPASLMGRAPEKGALPPRGVPLYNLWHTYVLPLALGAALTVGTGAVPWPLLGWLIHITLDRAAGFGLRAADGRQGTV